jgi:hypothetical protein
MLTHHSLKLEPKGEYFTLLGLLMVVLFPQKLSKYSEKGCLGAGLVKVGSGVHSFFAIHKA